MSCDGVVDITAATFGSIKENEDEDYQGISQDVLDLCDASTVVNVSLQKKEKGKSAKKRKLEDVIDITDNKDSEISTSEVEILQEETEESVNHVHKVVGWLKDTHFGSNVDSDNIEENLITHIWLNEDSPNPVFFTKNIRRIRVFLLDADPSLDNELLDLVSGYCFDGCRRFSVYSTVHWTKVKNYDIPLCPSCFKTEVEKELKLMFKVKLRVMDSHGIHVNLNVWKEHAEEFFGCSVTDFVQKPLLRETVVSPLRQYTLANTLQQKYTPLLDVCLVCFKNFYFVVNSRLKKTNKSLDTK